MLILLEIAFISDFFDMIPDIHKEKRGLTWKTELTKIQDLSKFSTL